MAEVNVPTSKKTLGKGILVFIFALLSLLAWSLSTPVGGTPDEDFHLASIWCGQGERGGFCEQGPTSNEKLVPSDLVYSAVCFAFDSNQSAACQRNGYGTGSELVKTDRGNFSGLYPPVFYWVMSWFVNEDINSSVLLMRFFNTVLFLVTLYVTSRLIKPKYNKIPFIVGFFTLIPLGVFLVPSINPSSWAITACIGAYFATSAWLQTNGKRKWISFIVINLMVLIGAGSRADAAIFVLLAITSSFFVNSSKIQWKTLLSYLPIVIGLAMVLLFVLTSGQAGVGTNGLEGDTKSSITGIKLLVVNVLQAPELWAGIFGYWGLGWLDTPMPAVIWVIGTLIFGYVYFSGFLSSTIRKKIVLVVLLLILWALPVLILFKSGLTVGAGVQPRYLLPILCVIACVSLDRAGTVFPVGFSIVQSRLLKTLIFVSFAISLLINYRRYESGMDVMSPLLWNNLEWSWPYAPFPMISWLVGTICFAMLLLNVSFPQNRLNNHKISFRSRIEKKI